MSGADYLRKRTAIACEICRARRSKCDAKKPACSKCVELEVECVYRKSNLWDREPTTAAAQTALGKVDDRLNSIQDSIAALSQQINKIERFQTNSNRTLSHSSPLALFPPSVASFDAYQGKGVPSSYRNLSSARPLGRMPNLLSFTSTASLGSFSYDAKDEFYTGETTVGDELFASLDETLLHEFRPDFAHQACWKLQRAFVTGFLHWMPIFDIDA